MCCILFLFKITMEFLRSKGPSQTLVAILEGGCYSHYLRSGMICVIAILGGFKLTKCTWQCMRTNEPSSDLGFLFCQLGGGKGWPYMPDMSWNWQLEASFQHPPSPIYIWDHFGWVFIVSFCMFGKQLCFQVSSSVQDRQAIASVRIALTRKSTCNGNLTLQSVYHLNTGTHEAALSWAIPSVHQSLCCLLRFAAAVCGFKQWSFTSVTT